MTEVWKPVRNYEGCYEVSSLGRLRRSVNRFGNPSGRPCRAGVAHGYPRYTLCRHSETRAIIAEADIPVIRRLGAAGVTQKVIAERYGVKVGAIGCILRGETWRHVVS